VLRALKYGRVGHVIYDPQVRHGRALGEDGLLLAPHEAAGVMVAQSHLTERIVERCLQTAARITPLDSAAAGILADADGIAALVRW
jgi:hypothetical protein